MSVGDRAAAALDTEDDRRDARGDCQQSTEQRQEEGDDARDESGDGCGFLGVAGCRSIHVDQATCLGLVGSAASAGHALRLCNQHLQVGDLLRSTDGNLDGVRESGRLDGYLHITDDFLLFHQ